MQTILSLAPRPPPFLPSVCIHNNTQERKTSGKRFNFCRSSIPCIIVNEHGRSKQGRPGTEAEQSSYFGLYKLRTVEILAFSGGYSSLQTILCFVRTMGVKYNAHRLRLDNPSSWIFEVRISEVPLYVHRRSLYSSSQLTRLQILNIISLVNSKQYLHYE